MSLFFHFSSFFFIFPFFSIFILIPKQDIYELPQKYGKVKNIKFSPNKNDRKSFVVTTENGIIFGNWVRNSYYRYYLFIQNQREY